MKMRRLSVALALALVGCGGKSTPTTTPPPDHGSGSATDTVVTPPPADPNDPVMPLDPAIKHGVLPNGLTYYILDHKKPEQRAYLWLAVNAGSAQEDDDQRGLAHLIEHMCFNGTKHFPKADIVNYLESIGMGFGADLNAETSFDNTTYKVSVPTDDQKFVDKGFDILRDWAGEVSFDQTELDKERGVVLEEWRLGRGAFERLQDKEFPILMKGSRYATRLPIGLPDTIKTAPRDALTRFYKDWYRPDLMAVIAVGDFKDTAAIEKEIAAKFGDLKNPSPERKRPDAGVPVADGTRVSIDTDKELPFQLIQVQNVFAHRSEATQKDFHRIVAESLYGAMINERFSTLLRKADAPYQFAQAGAGSYTREVDVFGRTAAAKPGKVEDSLRSLFAEVLRIEKFGFTQTELDRARTNISRGYDQAAVEAATQESDELVDEATRNFYEHEFMIGRVAERDGALAILPTITLQELNTLASSYGGAANRVISIAGPEGKPLPTEKEVLAIVDDVEKQPLTAWEDKAAVTTLMAETPKPGVVKSEKTNDKLGLTIWTLANGVKVIVKPTDYEQDQFSIYGTSPGGMALATKAQFNNARFATQIANLGGLADMDADTLGKALTGKSVNYGTSLNASEDVAFSSGSVRDLETGLQLIHLAITKPRKDVDQFKIWQTNTAQSIDDGLRQPETQFNIKSAAVLYKGDYRATAPTADDIRKVDIDKALAFYTERFGDASDFTFTIVGNLDLAKLKPLVETYLGSLPGKGRKDKLKDATIPMIGGVVNKSWAIGQEPKAHVEVTYHGDEKWKLDNDRDIQILGDALSIRLREVLREDLGGVYGVGAYGNVTRIGKGEREFTIEFGCDPTRVDELVKAMQAEIAKITKDGVSDEIIEKIKTQYLRERERGMKTNGFWVSWLSYANEFGDDPATVLDPTARLARFTNANIKASAKRYLDPKQYYVGVLMPAAGTPATSAAPVPAPATK